MDKSIELFYTPVPQEVFEELRIVCITFWCFMFKEEKMAIQELGAKLEPYRTIENEGCNFMYMLNKFHAIYRKAIYKELSIAAKHEVRIRCTQWENEFYTSK